ncbi:osmotically-inducible protein OsmY [Dongia mobilis]|uniref:Osmotically-inducible protein OsmY n=1 Tax=Dongia mobilis TaxID=578943 RepID=A0A4R6WSY1_9PROT|nr:BON domain-containing protein [Dongia mobilis]TDQ86356.1 osmotically-inducible protein OsmY [Dongia mobilis]
MNRARIPFCGKVPAHIPGTRAFMGVMAGGGLVLLLGACSPVGTAVGVAATTINLATQERGLVTGVDDNLIWVGINERMFRKDAELFQKVSLQVHEGRVLLTGFVQKPEHRVMATELAWQADGVREVDNQIKIGNSLGVDDYAEDAWLIARLRMKLMADSQVRANNYSIDCIRSTVYLIGVAQDKAELQRVIDHARDIPYVDAVVARVRLLDEALPPVPDAPPIIRDSPIAGEPLLVEAQPPAPLAKEMGAGGLPKSTPAAAATPQAAKPFVAQNVSAQPGPFQAVPFQPQPPATTSTSSQPPFAKPFVPAPSSTSEASAAELQATPLP